MVLPKCPTAGCAVVDFKDRGWRNKFRISENKPKKSRHLKADTRVMAMARSAKESLSPTRNVRCAKVSFSIANLANNIKVTV